MDCFLSEGIETIFRIALTLLMIAKHELLLLDMEGVIKYFQVGLCLFAIILLFVKLQFLPQMTNSRIYYVTYSHKLYICNICIGRINCPDYSYIILVYVSSTHNISPITALKKHLTLPGLIFLYSERDAQEVRI